MGSLFCSNLHCRSDIVIGKAGLMSKDDVAAACLISFVACCASFIIGCKCGVFVGVVPPLMCNRCISNSFILSFREFIVLLSRLPFCDVGRWYNNTMNSLKLKMNELDIPC